MAYNTLRRLEPAPSAAPLPLLELVESVRVRASRLLARDNRADLGQFMTPSPVAALMAGMISFSGRCVRILDAGAGCGSLFAAAVVELAGREDPPHHIHVTAFELDGLIIPFLEETVDLCRHYCAGLGIAFTCTVKREDFLDFAVSTCNLAFFGDGESFDVAIQNPPYGKINTNSLQRSLLRCLGLEASNIYAGFLGATALMLKDGGELVSITPRSFCNGPYFKPFRSFFLGKMALRRLHVFNSRAKAFKDDEVLQETVIVAATKGAARAGVVLSSSADACAQDTLERKVPYDLVVQPGDKDLFIHLQVDALSSSVAGHVQNLPCSLAGLGLSVSTGRVVDFRATEYLRPSIGERSVPLLYPLNLKNSSVSWPVQKKKPQALALAPETMSLLVPSAHYVLVKRFSSKEERRRVVAAVFDPDGFSFEFVGIENHINYFHANGAGLNPEVGKGLCAFLNSSMVDAYFRQFNGHTQVNASDLRSLRYPNSDTLSRLGRRIGMRWPTQDELDQLVKEEVFTIAENEDPMELQKRIEEALEVLKALKVAREQQNERSALALLALLDLKPSEAWGEAKSPLIGITPMMTFAKANYGKEYAPNTRETFRRQTMHQFLNDAIADINPDAPRPTNSPGTVYQVTPEALKVFKAFGAGAWDKELKSFLAQGTSLRAKYEKRRELHLIPVTVGGEALKLSGLGQNVLVKEILEEFAPRFTPGGDVLYLGDTSKKEAFYKKDALAALGVEIEGHAKIPDVVIHYTDRDWLVLVEAVTSHGPINEKRHVELQELFGKSSAGLVFVTTFLDRGAMKQYLPEIGWETEVWVADAPDHLIHFNGERFLGPY